MYCRSKRLLRIFNKCSKPYYLNYVEDFALYSIVLISGQIIRKLATFSKIRVAFNNVSWKILGVSNRSSASAMFVTNDISNFEAFLRKSIYSFNFRILFSRNYLICAIEQSWVMKTIWKMWEDKMYIKAKYAVFCVFILFTFYALLASAFNLFHLV